MKLKLIFRYVLSIAIIVTLVVVANLVLMFILMNYPLEANGNSTREIEDYVRNFDRYVHLDEKGKVYVDQDGRVSLDEKKLWIQVLDENANEVYSYNKPKIVEDKHSPIDIINGYKYRGGLGDTSSVLAGEKVLLSIRCTYLIGFPRDRLSKYVFILDNNRIITYLKVFIIIDFGIVLLFGYIFSIGLVKPVRKIIKGVEDLSEGKYNIFYKEDGLYTSVFNKLNKLSDELKRNELERKKIEKMRDEWIANISHDIKTPLASINGYAEILEGEYEFSEEELNEYANIIQRKAYYIKELVDDLNLTMKLKNKVLMLNKKEINLVAIVKNTVIDIFNDPKYRDVDVEFICEVEEIITNLDDNLIRRVINNLIYNALIHNDGSISIRVRLFQKEKIHLVIEDNGKGISEEEVPYIFERYYRGTNTGEAHKGSGLGMAIVKEIVNAHNGKIKLSSNVGAGVRIEIVLS